MGTLSMACGGFRFYYSVFSTYNFDTYQFGYQHELVSFCVFCGEAVPSGKVNQCGSSQRDAFGINRHPLGGTSQHV
jgi:hypothetical protein